MPKLVTGLILSFVTISLTFRSIRCYYQHDDRKASSLIAIVSTLGVLISIFGLIIPGTVEIQNAEIQQVDRIEIQNCDVNIYGDVRIYTDGDLPEMIAPDVGATKIQVSIKQRKKVGDTWASAVFANVGEEVEYQVHFRNDGDDAENVVMLITLPTDMELIPESVMFYNSITGKEGLSLPDDIVTEGAVSIGGYGRFGEAYVRFRAKVTDTDLTDRNLLRTWVVVQVDDVQERDEANVVVIK